MPLFRWFYRIHTYIENIAWILHGSEDFIWKAIKEAAIRLWAEFEIFDTYI